MLWHLASRNEHRAILDDRMIGQTGWPHAHVASVTLQRTHKSFGRLEKRESVVECKLWPFATFVLNQNQITTYVTALLTSMFSKM